MAILSLLTQILQTLWTSSEADNSGAQAEAAPKDEAPAEAAPAEEPKAE